MARVWILFLGALFSPDYVGGQQPLPYGGHSSLFQPSISAFNAIHPQDDSLTFQTKYNHQPDLSILQPVARPSTRARTEGGPGWPYRHRRFGYDYGDFSFRPSYPVGLVETVSSYLQQIPLAEQGNSSDSSQIPSQRFFLNSGL